MKRLVSYIVAILLIVSCVGVLVACGEASDGTGSGSSGSGSALVGSGYMSGSSNMDSFALTKNKTIGVVDKGDTIKQVSLLNLTGQDIKSFTIKHSFEDSFGANMMEADDAFQLDEVRDVFYDIQPALDAQAAKKSDTSSETTGNFSELSYDVQVTVADGTSYVLHNFPFNDMQQGRILLQNGILFLEYVNPWTGDEVITRQAEMDVKAEEEKAAAEEASRIAAEQAAAWAAQQQAQQQQWAQQQQQYVAPAPSNDSCIGNSGLMY